MAHAEPCSRIFKTNGISDLHKDTDLAIWLLGWLDKMPYPWDKNRVTAREIADTCQIAEATQTIIFHPFAERMTTPALQWLANLSTPGAQKFNDDSSRVYPSRFKTLAMLGAFNSNSGIRADFHTLSNKFDPANGKVMTAISKKEMPPEQVTLIWLDTLLHLEKHAIDLYAWREAMTLALSQLEKAFACWLETGQSPEDYPLDEKRDASYALDVLVRSERVNPHSALVRTSVEKLTSALRQQRARQTHVLSELYLRTPALCLWRQ